MEANIKNVDESRDALRSALPQMIASVDKVCFSVSAILNRCEKLTDEEKVLLGSVHDSLELVNYNLCKLQLKLYANE